MWWGGRVVWRREVGRLDGLVTCTSSVNKALSTSSVFA